MQFTAVHGPLRLQKDTYLLEYYKHSIRSQLTHEKKLPSHLQTTDFPVQENQKRDTSDMSASSERVQHMGINGSRACIIVALEEVVEAICHAVGIIPA